MLKGEDLSVWRGVGMPSCSTTLRMSVEFVTEFEDGHKSALLEPEYGTERAHDEDAFGGSK
jgi:hypothetical protein